jgi:hypothetical protein
MLLARALLAGTAAVAATASLAVADAAPHDRDRPPALVEHAAPVARRPALAPVTEAAVDPAVLASVRATGATSTVASQVVRLEVVGGGLTIDHDRATVTLAPTDDPRVWSSPLPPVRIVDARGTFDGWRARWRATSLTAGGRRVAGNVTVDTAVAVVDGLAGGLDDGHGRTLAAARPGWGAGTYEVTGRVTVRLAASAGNAGTVVELGYEIG